MQTVSATFLDQLRTPDAFDPAYVVEIYPPETVPGDEGFDPADAELRFASVSGIAFAGQSYTRMIPKDGFGSAQRSSGPTFNSFTFKVSNSDRTIAAWVLSKTYGVEGYHVVYRLISRSVSVDLEDSIAEFTGRLEKPFDFDRSSETVTFSAKQHLGGVDKDFPRRNFTVDDLEGRAQDDPLFEGFPFTPTPFSITTTSKGNSGLLGGLLGGLVGFLFSRKKAVTRTLAYTSTSDVDANMVVPEVLGRTQMIGKPIVAADEGDVIRASYAWAEGPIQGYENERVLTPGYTRTAVFRRFGELGGSTITDREQTPIGGPGLPGDRNYSRTAYTVEGFVGAKVEVEEPAPSRVSIVVGRRVPLPDADGIFLDTNGDDEFFEWTDNPAYLVRWLLTWEYGFNLPAELIDDEVCIETATYCEQSIEDEANSERTFIPTGITGGTEGAIRYLSTSVLTPEHWRRRYLLDDTVDPWAVEPTYEEFNPTDASDPDLTPVALLRRRYTINVPITDTMKVVDVLFKILCPASRLYLVQGANSKIQIRVKKPVDNTTVRASVSVGATEIPVKSVLAWLDDVSGQALIGHTLTSSECRVVTGIRYSTAGNSITLAVSGGLTASGATFAGGTNTTTPATATVTVGDATGGTITIDGVTVGYTGTGSDVQNSIGAMLASAVNANPTLNTYIKATWDAATPNTVSLQSKLGYLVLASATGQAHANGVEIIRVAMSFSDRADDQANLTRSNILKGSGKWPGGSRQSTVNQAKGTYRDAVQDYKSTPLVVNDLSHQTQTGKTSPIEVDISACDNHHQASRVLNGVLAELRDGDFFFSSDSDREALLLEEGDVICITDASGGFVNLAVRIEDITIKGYSVSFTGRRYLTSMYDDAVIQKTVPLPTTLVWNTSAPPVPTDLTLEEINIGATNSTVRGTFTFAAYPGAQVGRVLVKVGAADFVDAGILINPDADNLAAFEIAGLLPETYEIKVRSEAGDRVSEYTSPESITTTTGDLAIAAGNLTLQDDTDGSKQVRFEIDGITTGTTRAIRLPNADDTLVGATVTQTLTNKTLTSPAISSPTGLVKADVGLGNVDNTSDATKNAAVATLTNKTLTSPVINTPTGIAKGDVGLGNVDNISDLNKPVSTAQAASIATKQPLDATLTSLSALGTAADKLAYTTGVDTWAEAALTAAGRALIDDADATAQRTTLALGTGDSPTFTAITIGAAPTPLTAQKIGVQYSPTPNSGSFAGATVQLLATPSASSSSIYYGYFAQVGTASGNANNLTNGLALVGNTVTMIHRGSGTVTGAAQYRAQTPTVTGGGAITICYGVYIDQQKVSGVGTGYGIYQVDTGDLNYFAGKVGIGATSPHASAIFQIDSTTKGAAFPRMTTTQRDAISSPLEGLVIYNLTTHKLNVFTGSAWEAVTSV